jgi:hypothetical protein
MALFGGSRDVSLIRRLNRELINSIINTEVIVYKIATQYIKTNIYGESAKKVFFNPMRINSLITREGKDFDGDDYTTFIREISFSFLRDDLKDLNLVIQEGDIIKWDAEYYELNLVSSNQLWMGRNPDTLLATVEDGQDRFGYNVSVVAKGMKTTADRLGIENIMTPRNSIYDLPNRI